jgi:hypothetical protein
MVPQSGNGVGSGNPHKDEGGLSSEFFGYVSGQSYSFLETYLTCLALFRIFWIFLVCFRSLLFLPSNIYDLFTSLQDFLDLFGMCQVSLVPSFKHIWPVYLSSGFFIFSRLNSFHCSNIYALCIPYELFIQN